MISSRPSQAWGKNAHLTQTFLQRNGFFRTKARANAASEAGVLITFGHSIVIDLNSLGGASLDTDPAACAGCLINHGHVVGRINEGKCALPPETQGIAAVLTAVTDARFRP